MDVPGINANTCGSSTYEAKMCTEARIAPRTMSPENMSQPVTGTQIIHVESTGIMARKALCWWIWVWVVYTHANLYLCLKYYRRYLITAAMYLSSKPRSANEANVAVKWIRPVISEQMKMRLTLFFNDVPSFICSFSVKGLTSIISLDNTSLYWMRNIRCINFLFSLRTETM